MFKAASFASAIGQSRVSHPFNSKQKSTTKRAYKIFNFHCFRNATVFCSFRIHFFCFLSIPKSRKLWEMKVSFDSKGFVTLRITWIELLRGWPASFVTCRIICFVYQRVFQKEFDRILISLNAICDEWSLQVCSISFLYTFCCCALWNISESWLSNQRRENQFTGFVKYKTLCFQSWSY